MNDTCKRVGKRVEERQRVSIVVEVIREHRVEENRLLPVMKLEVKRKLEREEDGNGNGHTHVLQRGDVERSKGCWRGDAGG